MVLTIFQILAIVSVTLPLSLGATVAGQWRWSQPVFFAISRVWGKAILRIARVRLTVRGAEHAPRGTSAVLVANHASMFDIFATLAATPANICFVLKRELTRVPVWGWGLIRSPYIVVNRESLRDARRGMAAAESRLHELDRTVLFFPEGTRTRDGKLQPFKRGAFAVAIAAGVPVIPIVVNGSFRILPKGTFRINGGHVEVIIGAPIPSGADETALIAAVGAFFKQNYREQ